MVFILSKAPARGFFFSDCSFFSVFLSSVLYSPLYLVHLKVFVI